MGHQDCRRSQAWCRRCTSRTAGLSIGQSGMHELCYGLVRLSTNAQPLSGQAQEKAKPGASAIYVPGNQTTRAIEEAIEAEIPLVVAVAEHVPIHDILRVGASQSVLAFRC